MNDSGEGFETIQDLMVQLDGAGPETIEAIAAEKGSLPVRLAMLGLASIRKGSSPLWWGYPPGVFLSYKWEGENMRALVLELAEHVRGQGYRAFLDVENLDEDADAYFQIPQYITSLQECTFYVLLLTELAGDLITARKGKTSWIFDEYQHAARLTNSGRLLIVPVLLEPGGLTDFFTHDMVLDLTQDPRAFGALDDMLAPDPISLAPDEIEKLAAIVERFDELFLGEQWEESDALLRATEGFGHTFDHQFRRLLHSIYTADQAGAEATQDRMRAVYGDRIVFHIYKGYCEQHGIPNRLTVE
jgi:hypothetical protein